MKLNSLEEAIKNCEEVAGEQENKARVLNGDFYQARRDACLKCAKEHRQLAEWLKELKAYRVHMMAYRMDLNARFEDAIKGNGYQNGIGTACDLFDSYLKEVNADEHE